MQPYFCPYLGYFQLMQSVDRFVLFDDVNYIKKGWINRNRVLVNGVEYLFTIPLEGMSQNKLICETMIVESRTWKDNLLKTVEHSYRKAPNFDVTYPIIQQILAFEERSLSRFIANSLSIFAAYIGMTVKIVNSSIGYANRCFRGQNRILDICLREGATHYHNATGGMELYDHHIFASKGVTLRFVKPHLTGYTQFGNDFISGLSIIDVLMFNSKKKIKSFLDEYELVYD